jgi:CO dehydrogenase nickel-insertion accessory protein CooC1
LENNKDVLALDNDHNMDFKFNLGHTDNMNWMGQSLKEIFEKISITSTKEVAYIDAEHIFSLSPIDDVTEKYTTKITDKDSGKELLLMAAGPHTPDMMYGNMCSHGLTTPLKVYLPFLKLNDNEFVIVDEKAGTDGVGTGVTTGFNLAVVVAEATTHGVKAAKQIIDMLKFYKTPYIVCVNKIRDVKDANIYDQEFLETGENILITHFNFDTTAFDLKLSEEYKTEFKKIYEYTNKLSDDRKERTKARIKKQKEFNDAK